MVSFARAVKGETQTSRGRPGDAGKAPQNLAQHQESAGSKAVREGPSAPVGVKASEGAGEEQSRQATVEEGSELPDRNSSVSAPPDLEITSRALFAFTAGYTSAFTNAQQQDYGERFREFADDKPPDEVGAIGAEVSRVAAARALHLAPAREPGMRREDSDASVEDLISRTARMPPLSNLARDDSEISLTSLAHVPDMSPDDIYLRDRSGLPGTADGGKGVGRINAPNIPSVVNSEVWKQSGSMSTMIDGSTRSKQELLRAGSPSSNVTQSQGLYYYNPPEQASSNYASQFAPFQQPESAWMPGGRMQVEAFRPAFPAAVTPFTPSKLASHGMYNNSGVIAGYGRLPPDVHGQTMGLDYSTYGRQMGRSNSKLRSGYASDYGQFEVQRSRHVPYGNSPAVVSRTVKGGGVQSSANGAAKISQFSEVIGRVKELARDQHGCRYLQTKLEEGNKQYVNIIFDECFGDFVDLMIDPFGNYLCQKLFEHCDDAQRLVLVQYCANSLARVSTNMHGTRAVQRMVECLSTPDQIATACAALAPSAVDLMKDINGNHVIQRCLSRMDSKDNQFVYDAVANNCLDLATHRHGCCVMQRCIDHASPAQKNQLVKQVTSNALLLVQNAYGNYVVQYVLELGDPNYTLDIIKQLQCHVGELSTQKFSSNVVEKCLQKGNAETRSLLIDELISDSEVIGRLLHDAFGNYVIQRSLQLARSPQLEALCEAIRPHLPSLKSSPYGKRIQSKILKRFPKNRGDRDDFNI